MGIDAPWLTQLPNEIQQFLIGTGSGFAGGVTSGIVVQFLNAIGRKAAKRFQTDAHKKALNLAMAKALYQTANKVTSDKDNYFHFIKVFSAWLERENVVDELSQLIDPNQSSELDLKLLEEEFTSVGFSAEVMQRDFNFYEVVGPFINNFRNALAAQPQLQEQIKIRLLDGLVQKTGTLIDESRKHTHTLERIEHRLAPADITPRLKEYLERQIEQNEYISLLGLDFKAADADRCADQRMSLSGVYIQLNTTSKHKKDVEKEERFDREAEPFTVIEALANQTEMVLLGDPGSGKSTFVNHLNYCLARNNLDPTAGWLNHLPKWPDRWANLIPIPIVLRQLTAWLNTQQLKKEKSGLLMAYLKYNLEQMDLEDLYQPLRDKIKNGEALLLLDGLDEVPADSDSSQKIIDMIDDLAVLNSPKLVTCRVLSYQDERWQLNKKRWMDFELDKLDNSQIDHFIGAWYGQLAQKGAAIDPMAKKEKLQAAVRRDDLAELARNPLLLTVMAIVHTHKGELPDSRAVLYEDVIELLLCRWETIKTETCTLDEPDFWQMLQTVGLQSIDFKKALWELAYAVHARHQHQKDKKTTADITENQLHKTLRKLHPDKSLDWADIILARMKLRAGLLIETKPEVYSFPHRTFQEYLAGCYLATHANFTDKARELAKLGAYWWDVILLAVGRMIHHGGDSDRPLILANELNPDEMSEDDTTVLRNVLLAGKIMVEIGLTRAKRRKFGLQAVETVRHNLVTLITHGLLTPRERSDAADCLSVLKDSRAGVRLMDGLPDIKWVSVSKGPFTMGSDQNKDKDAQKWEMPQFTCHQFIYRNFEISFYPITVAQYQAFIEDKGYLQKRYWTDEGWQWRSKNDVQKPGIYPGVFQLENHPQVGVSWYEAVAFCNWLSEKSGEAITLPTEAQWERSARHIDGRIYPWGDKFEPDCCNSYETGLNSTSAVGIFPQSDAVCGAADMSGNVFEWCLTKYRGDYQDYEKKVNNDLSSSEPRVLRGGGWYYRRFGARCASRNWSDPDDRDDNIGFRCVRT